MKRETRTDKGYVRVDDKYRLGILNKETMEEVQLTGKGSGILGALMPAIIKTGNDQPVPDNEPRILFRGRDRLALPMLVFYRELCVADGCNDFQLRAIDGLISEFKEFAETSPTMKQPGITRGK